MHGIIDFILRWPPMANARTFRLGLLLLLPGCGPFPGLVDLPGDSAPPPALIPLDALPDPAAGAEDPGPALSARAEALRIRAAAP